MGVIILLIQPGSWWGQNPDDGVGDVVAQVLGNDLVPAQDSYSLLITVVTDSWGDTTGVNSTVVG